jgi:hypothetical protein
LFFNNLRQFCLKLVWHFVSFTRAERNIKLIAGSKNSAVLEVGGKCEPGAILVRLAEAQTVVLVSGLSTTNQFAVPLT